ncbi:right-handed parallel beta-helix repeat-containing protein [Burkholderia seminalis]|uniref:right-handed parallel beta-helix repeat-containing protein n=1 Tax=Burkholderia seminalis TaxID=488731 RepID=UPI001CF1140F|nr:right-handed parallel beta-helix repeat-containing protein [Burkholderia seminalis]MCA8425323.1 right-handed parallel beta-helix repeat-containing protein [Burkholderia seminalis]
MTRSFRIVGAAVVAWACAVASFSVQVCAATLTEYTAPRHAARARPAVRAVPAAVTVRAASDGSDQTDALQAALNALQAGQTLILAPGRYTVSRSLSVATSGVVVSGYGATLVATNPSDQTIVMSGAGSTLVGVTLVGTGTTRLTTPASTKVEVTGTGVQVLGVTIQGGASAGIFVFGGSNVAIVGNTVSATLADGIHTTYGSTNVLVQNNTVKGTGDDLIAVVSYLGDGRVSSNVLIDRNTVSGNAWGRGIAVVGGQAVTISNNTVDGVQKAAGILLAQEDSWKTYGVSNVVIDGNVVTNVQNSTVNNGLQPTQQAALELDTWSGTVSTVTVTRNRVTGSGYAGFRALGNVCDFEVAGNTFAAIAGSAVSLLSSGCTASRIVASGNTLDGVALVPPVGASSSGTIAAAGAATTAMPQVRTGLMQSSGSAAPAAGAAR